MKALKWIWTGVVVLAMTPAAHAVPQVSGKYILMSHTQCEARLATTLNTYLRPPANQPTSGPAVQSLSLTQSGELGIGVGSITFPAPPASSGTARFEAFIVSGGSLRLNNIGNAMAAHSESAVGTFSFTNTTFTFDPTGPEPPMTWVIRFAPAANVVTTLYMVRRENLRCLNAITATKQ